jgi:hypothetical protein
MSTACPVGRLSRFVHSAYNGCANSRLNKLASHQSPDVFKFNGNRMQVFILPLNLSPG